jgi:hypothetical protein
VGPTSASKVLHIIAPRFFVMWDSRIRRLYRVGTSSRSYVRFIHVIHRHWFVEEALIETLLRLEREFGVSKLRLIDAYNYVITREMINT